MEFYSHTNPDKKLIDHLTEVAELSRKYGAPRFAEIHYIIGISHDFGKYMTFPGSSFRKKGPGMFGQSCLYFSYIRCISV